jgi:hypothetical protein
MISYTCTECHKLFDSLKDICGCDARIIAGMTCDMAGCGGVN